MEALLIFCTLNAYATAHMLRTECYEGAPTEKIPAMCKCHEKFLHLPE